MKILGRYCLYITMKGLDFLYKILKNSNIHSVIKHKITERILKNGNFYIAYVGITSSFFSYFVSLSIVENNVFHYGLPCIHTLIISISYYHILLPCSLLLPLPPNPHLLSRIISVVLFYFLKYCF